ncbi:hypothetical protein DTW89_02665 [Acidovorax sp. BoFeN1]|uniref:hypothetical protein n=1 Tax=Acidovorax sp. BoFeN1 TaxID=1231053 RepID=UPI000E099C66|nr:hypothetical protein [Acidovorax sp. BoFeN1]RDD95237.1 hypothetical protein DTW89_02665 [Acidovorax sp. BoFeN1]
MAHDSSIWQVDTHTAPVRPMPNADTVPLTWAHDSRTGEPRYIHDPEVIDGSAECQCPACDLSLTPVLAGQPLRRNPTAHFRHPKGAQKDDCTLVAARLAAIRHLQERGFIDLPRRRMSANATGFSGQGYEGWAEKPGERVSITSAVLHDHATALLTLDDGREFLVDLTGQRVAGSDGQGRAIVTLFLSDPAIAMMSPDDIRARLRLLPDIRWCAHWDDQALQAAASAQAQQTAREAMDAWEEADEALFRQHLPSDLEPAVAQQWRRETLLHSEVKAILEQASQITTPGLDVEVTRYAPDEFSGEWEDNTLRIQWMTASTTLPLENTQLEQRQGSIVPDVICTLREPRPYIYGFAETRLDGAFEELIEDTHSSQQWPRTVLIEVTVTHGIDQEKLRRIQALNMSTLEIDIGSLGGRVTREGLRHLVVNETIGKRWVHHPAWRLRLQLLETELDQHPVSVRFQERLAELRRPRLLATPASEWVLIYLAAATEFHDANTRIDKARRAHKGERPAPVLLGKDSEPWLRLMEAAEALAAHGYPGAADPEMVGVAGIISRLLSIRHNRGVGYAFDTGYQVLNAITQSGPGYQQWHTLYPMAVKTYALEARFTPKQAERYASWRQGIIDKVDAGDETHLRPARYDAVLGVLFPEMAPRLANGYGRSQQSQ